MAKYSPNCYCDNEDRQSAAAYGNNDLITNKEIKYGNLALYYKGYEDAPECSNCERMFTSSGKRFCKLCGRRQCGYDGYYPFDK